MDIKKIKKLKKILVKDGNMLRIYRFFKFIPDKLYLKFMFRFRMGQKLDFKNPKTFSQKLQYLKIHDRKPIYSVMVDKLRANEYVKEKCGSQVKFAKILGEWDRFEDINFGLLPEKFVLKCNHNSGCAVICTDKSLFDNVKYSNSVKKKLNFAVKHNYFWAFREWPYKDITPKIIAEEYICDSTGKLPDYKIFTFNGQAKLIYVRTIDIPDIQYEDFFDISKNHLDICDEYPMAPEVPMLPDTINQMLTFAEQLSEGTKHLRVDFYDVNGDVYFGELTFFHECGFAQLKPERWDSILGSFIDLNVDVSMC